MEKKKILVANRGEIAIRIFKTLNKMGFVSVGIYTDFEKEAMHIKYADEVEKIDGETLFDTYLNINKIIDIAKSKSCVAIHPGYGFLSENADFAGSCMKERIVFIGPKLETIESLGNKELAKMIAQKLDIPVLQSVSLKNTKNPISSEIEFPVLIKASNGGGGRGMRIVRNYGELQKAMETAKLESLKNFNSEDIYLEKYLENPRHIEVQILGDKHDNYIHLFERECSVQRRFQKIIEEAPAVNLGIGIKNKLYDYALRIAKEIKYESAGTIEFLVDQNENVFFLEVNTRIQVEHPVTEMITNVDIVEQQINIALGKKISFSQDEISLKGHSIECRVCAEDTANNFIPSLGKIFLCQHTNYKNSRLDTGYQTGSDISHHFDSMISKVIVWDNNREKAMDKMIMFLKDYHIHGVKTNISYLLNILNHQQFRNGILDTGFIAENHTSFTEMKNPIPPYLAMAAIFLNKKNSGNNYWRLINIFRIIDNGIFHRFYIRDLGDHCFSLKTDKSGFAFDVISMEKSNYFKIGHNAKIYHISINDDKQGGYHIGFEGKSEQFQLCDEKPYIPEMPKAEKSNKNGLVLSPIHGKITKINVEMNKKVLQNDTLIIIESMKMENAILAPKSGVVHKIDVKVGEQVDTNMVLMEVI